MLTLCLLEEKVRSRGGRSNAMNAGTWCDQRSEVHLSSFQVTLSHECEVGFSKIRSLMVCHGLASKSLRLKRATWSQWNLVHLSGCLDNASAFHKLS